MTKVAVIDCGSNAIRLLITDSLKVDITRKAILTRLGHKVDSKREISKESLSETLEVIKSYLEEIHLHEVDRVKIIATSAIRDAKNKHEFLALVEEMSGIKPEVLSGYQEAKLTFMGATFELDSSQPVVVIDIGGGSTELVLGSPGSEPITGGSLDIGSVRLFERFIKNDPPTTDEIANLKNYLTEILSLVLTRIERYLKPPFIAIAVAGTARALWQLSNKAYSDKSNGLRIELKDLEEINEMLASLNVKSKIELGIEEKRADILVVGGIILQTLLRQLKTTYVLYSQRDLLDGVALQMLSKPNLRLKTS